MQAPQQGVVYAAAPQAVTYAGAPGGYTYMTQPAADGTYLADPSAVDAGQVVYVQDGQQMPMEGYAVQEGVDGQVVYGAPMVTAPARVNVSHDIFAKLAAGGQLTPDEMEQLTGQSAPAPVMPGSPQASGAVGTQPGALGQPGAAPSSAKASGKKDKKSKDGSKKSLKASKKKAKGCC